MRVAIHTLGTRGDIQPYLALAIELKRLGHEVLIAAPTQFQAFIGIHGIRFAHLPGEFLSLMETPEAKSVLAGSNGFSGGFKLMKQFRPIGRRQLTDEWRAAERFEPELIIYHPKAIGATHIGEKLAIPTVLASPLPGFTPTRSFASPLVPCRSIGPLNRTTHRIMANGAEAIFKGMISEWRRSELGLTRRPARKLKPSATLYAYSKTVLPVPEDWPPDVAVTGYWFMDDGENWRPGDSLQKFLDEGLPPVYVGFGSMPGFVPVELTRLVVDALRLAGLRGVLATGGGALSGDVKAPHVHVIDSAPHDKLFPLMAACVHHGGAGTTGAALRAGKPQVICPFCGDQPFWARRAVDLGVAPRALDRKRLTPDALVYALCQATGDSQMQSLASRLGSLISQETGTARAIEFLLAQGLLQHDDQIAR